MVASGDRAGKIRAEIAELNNDIVNASIAIDCAMKRLRRANQFLNAIKAQEDSNAQDVRELRPWIEVISYMQGKKTHWAIECPDCGRFITVHDMEKDIKFSYCPFCGKKRKGPERKGKDEKD